LLPKWKEQPGMVGVRLTFQAAMEKLLTEGHADWFWPLAEKYDLPVMFFAPGNIPKFASVAERHPRLAMIIDHMSLNQDIAREGKIAEAIGPVVAMAKYPNVSVKVSSAPNFSKEPYPWRDTFDAIKRCFDAYGPRRCYWGTDLTNSLAKATYRQRITQFTEELPFLSEQDKDWVMGKAILERLKWA
jgi:predicted TIM-barrel fold metal-dependent hydrolase